MIRSNRPKAVFLENVQNIVSHDNGNTIETIVRILEDELDYKIIGVTKENGKYIYSHDSFVRNTRCFGLPQNRPRAYFIAFDRKLYGKQVNKLPNELPRKRKEGSIFNSVDEILEPIVDIHYYMSATYLETLKRHAKTQKSRGNGFGYCIVNAPNRDRRYANTILATGGSGKERNLIVQPMPDCDEDTVLSLNKKGGLNKENVRIMTPKEWGRLQGFIDYAFDDFSFPDNVPESQQYKQFGNSVSIPVIEEMASFMYECFKTMNLEQDKLIINETKIKKEVSVHDVAYLLQCSNQTARMKLNQLVEDGKLLCSKEGKARSYHLSKSRSKVVC